MKYSEPVIVKCTISSYPRTMEQGFFDPMPEVRVQFDNGEEKTLFEFYPDEIDFKEDEFIGLTEKDARHLKFEKDKRYIQS
jgi:hypothetical protein